MCISVDDTIKEAEARIAQFLDQRYRCHEIMKPGSPMPRRPHGAFLQDVALQVSAEKVRIFSDIEFFPCFFFIFSYLLIAAMVLLVSWQIDQCYFMLFSCFTHVHLWRH